MRKIYDTIRIFFRKLLCIIPKYVYNTEKDVQYGIFICFVTIKQYFHYKKH